MHFALGPYTLAAITALSLLGAGVPAGLASAAPVARQDATQAMTGVVDPAELALEPAAFTVDAGDGQGAAIEPPGTTQGPATRIERSLSPANAPLQTRLESQSPAAKQPAVKHEPDLIAEIRSTVKESVLPLHDQLAESGALEAWHELKTDLGLSKWGNEGGTEVDPSLPGGRADASHSASWQDPTHRPPTAGQTEVDREVAAMMLEKLIDEIKPWAFSVGGLYLLGYLIKTGYDYSRRKSMRRRERKGALSRRRHARKLRSANPDAPPNHPR